MPDGSGHLPTDPKIEARSQTTNGNRLANDIRKGDILIVEGGWGHAAIATTDTYILEMSGGGNPASWFMGGIPDNNHQFNKINWIFGDKTEQGVKSKTHIRSWVQLWRPRGNASSLAADYADATFWNSNHAYQKNRHISYAFNSGTLTLNPNYCSKMVWQAYWYGTGDLPVIADYSVSLTGILPNALVNTFNSDYQPYLVGRY